MSVLQVVLIHPPVNDPRSPRLALPALAAFLRRAGVQTRLVDLDLDSLLATLAPPRIAAAAEILRARSAPPSGPRSDDLRRILAGADALPGQIDQALRIIRDPNRFFDANDLRAAREVTFDCVELLGAACARPVTYRLDLLQYDVEGVDPARFDDLVAVTADSAANVFAAHWEAEFFPSLAREPWALAGISLATPAQLIPALTCARELRKRGHFVVIGGTFLARYANRLAGLPQFFDHFADAVVIGDGETTLLALVEQLAGKRDLGRVPNLIFKSAGRLRTTRRHQEDVNALPTPDFAGLPLDGYLTPRLVLPISLGRGCYWNRCKFCTSNYTNRCSEKTYRVRTPEAFVKDVSTLRERFNCTHFLFSDEAVPPNLLGAVAKILRRRRIRGLRFAAYARLEPGFTAAVCRQAASAGVVRLFFGLESACQATLDHMAKGIRVAHARRVLRNCRAAGISYHVFSMIGFPEEDESRARQTGRFFAAHHELFSDPGNSFDIHLLELLAKSQYMREARAQGVKIPRGLLARDFVTGIGRNWKNTRGLSNERVEALLREFAGTLAPLYGNYHAWPSVLWPGLEEWALLYAAEYAGRPFPFRISLPPDGTRGHCRLRWHPFAVVRREGTAVRVEARGGGIVVAGQLYEAIRTAEYQPVAQLVRLLAGRRIVLCSPEMTALRENLCALLRANLLQLRFAPAAAAGHGGCAKERNRDRRAVS